MLGLDRSVDAPNTFYTDRPAPVPPQRKLQLLRFLVQIAGSLPARDAIKTQEADQPRLPIELLFKHMIDDFV